MQIQKTSGMLKAAAPQKDITPTSVENSAPQTKPAPSDSVTFSDSQESDKGSSIFQKMFVSPVGRVATGILAGGATGLATGAAGGNPVVAKAISATVGGAAGVVGGAGVGFIVSLPFALMNNSSKPMSIGAGVGAVGGGALGVYGGMARGEMIAAFGSYLGGGVVGHTAAGALIGGGAALLTLA